MSLKEYSMRNPAVKTIFFLYQSIMIIPIGKNLISQVMYNNPETGRNQ